MGRRATPPAPYRFVADGFIRRNRGPEDADSADELLATDGRTVRVPYRIASDEFAVRPWSGVTAENLRLEDGGAVSFRVGPRSSVPFTTTGGAPATAGIGPIDHPDP